MVVRIRRVVLGIGGEPSSPAGECSGNAHNGPTNERDQTDSNPHALRRAVESELSRNHRIGSAKPCQDIGGNASCPGSIHCDTAHNDA